MERHVAASVKNRELVRERRERLVRAASGVFLRRGYHAATVREIGREAGLTQGTIYNYVRSKGDILYLVCDEVVSAYQEAVRHATEGIAEPVARLAAALRALVEVMHERQDEILILYHDSHALDRRALRAILARVAGFIRSVEDMLAAAAREGRVVVDNVRLAANMVTFLPTIVALRRWDLPRGLARPELVDGVTRFMLRGLGADDGGGPSPAGRRR